MSFLRQLEKDKSSFTNPKAQGALDILRDLKKKEKKLQKEGAPESVIGDIRRQIEAQDRVVMRLFGEEKELDISPVKMKKGGKVKKYMGGGKVYTTQNKRYAYGGKVSGRKATYKY